MNGARKQGLDRRLRWFCYVAGISLSAAASAQFDIAQNPLFISTNTAPNVMLSIDNSGSMENIIWDAGFDPTVTYPNWGNGGEVERKDNSGSGFGGFWDAQSTLNRYSFVYCEPPPVGGTTTLTPLRVIINGTFDDIFFDEAGGSNTTFFNIFENYGIYGRRVVDGVTTEACINVPQPLSLATRYLGNYINYLFETYATNGSNTSAPGLTVPNQSRIQVARNVSSAIVGQNQSLRFGIATFNPPRDEDGDGTVDDSGPGGSVIAQCATRDASGVAALQSTIAGIQPRTNTPLAETYYEITRYFRGLTSAYNPGVSHTSPQQFRCQRNFVISITDGFPTYDTTFPTAGDTEPTASDLPNYDGLAPTTATADFPANFPAFSDGYQPNDRSGAGEAEEGFSLYLDDIARFGQVLDTKTAGTDLAGGSYEAPEFDPQNLTTYTVGIALDLRMLLDAAQAGDGLFFRADNEQQLLDSLNTAIQDILARTSSAASVATNSTRLSADTLVFQARFSSADWSGDLIARSINADGSIGSVAWRAAAGIPAPNARKIFTLNTTTGAMVDFVHSAISPAQQDALDLDAGGVDDGGGEIRLALLRGNTLATPDARFRQRSSLMGDVINSDPAFVGSQDFGFRRLPGSEGGSYPAFVQSKSNRKRLVFVGANDGMFRGIDASNGNEVFAYVPGDLYENGRLGRIVDADYTSQHRFYVDGSTRTVDAYLGGSWKSVVLGTTGAGGRAVFAIDADPAALNANSVLWEYSDSDDDRLGTTIPIVTAARMANGKWAAIVGNGYNSRTNRARLFIIDLETGNLIRQINTRTGSDSDPNGLSSPIPVDIDNDKITDFIYAGDLQGNMWKFDVRDSSSGNWDVAFTSGTTKLPLFTACGGASCTSTNRQPITTRPEVGLNPQGGVIVYFGTGKYFENSDNIVGAGEPVQSFYGVFDMDAPLGGGQSNLLEQTVISDTFSASFNATVRVTSNNSLDSADLGWYIDLPVNGERQVAPPILRPGRIVFTTLIPDADPCGSGGTSFIMELDAVSGSRLETESPFDLNDDKKFDDQDYIEITNPDGTTERVAVSGKLSDVGIIKTPGVLQTDDPNADGDFEFKYASGTSGGIEVLRESSGLDRGRLSWRQIR